MDPRCIDAVNRAAGRELTDAQIRAIDSRMSATMRRLAREDPEWRGKTLEVRLQAAAAQAASDIRAEAARKVENAQRQVLATADAAQRVARQRELGAGTHTEALVRDMENTGNYIAGVKNDAVRGMLELLEAGKSGEGAGLGRRALMALFDADNPAMSRDLAVEIFSLGRGGTGNTIAQRAAQVWLETTEALRTRFNAAGGDVRRLDYGYLPQPHDQGRVLQAGREAWAAQLLPRLDRSRYVNEDGSRMSDAQVLDVLRSAFDSISSDGLNKLTPGQFRGTGARANSGSESRQIHFRDADSYLAYMAEFGRGSMYDAMVGHVGGMARDIGLVERYGPNPEQNIRVQTDAATKADGGEQRVFGLRPDSYWAVLNGAASTPQSPRIAMIGRDLRNIQTAAKLGAAVISSITDIGTYFVTTGFNKLPYWDAIANIARQGSKDTREFLAMHGVIADSLISDLSRWSGDHLGHNWAGRLANSTMKLSLMNAWSDSLRNAFQMTMMAGLGRLSRKQWAQLDDFDRARLERHGITERDWAIIQRAELTEHAGQQFLTPEALYAVDVGQARPEALDAVRARIEAETGELVARNVKEQGWIQGRLAKFDDARDSLNRAVKALRDRKLAKNEAATEPLLQRMALLDAQREQAQLQAALEADFNRLATQDEMRAFLNAVEDGASADKTARGPAGQAVRSGLAAAEGAGRRYGVQKGKLQERMRALEQRIAEMDRKAGREVDAAAKEAQAKADAMGKELAEFIQRSQERQGRRQFVIDRILSEEGARVDAEVLRIRQEIAAKVLGLIKDEGEFAVINPDLATRAIVTGGGAQAGTVRGELARSITQFKSFPIAMISRHWRRMMEQRPEAGAPMLANRLAYGAGMAVSLTVLGAVAFQIKQLIAGKDPAAMDTPKFWIRAGLQGGAMGILGDLFLQDPADSPGDSTSNMAKNVLGPVAGSAIELGFKVGAENVWQAAKGKETHAGAEALRWAKSNTPLINLWYTRAAIDHAFLQQLQENLSPGYLARMRARARAEWGQDYWWTPGEQLPERAPDFTAAGGR